MYNLGVITPLDVSSLLMLQHSWSNIKNEENDFLLTLQWRRVGKGRGFTAAVMLLLDSNQLIREAKTVPSYDAKVVSQVHASSKVHEQASHEKSKTIIQTMDDDRIDFNIIFDDPFVEIIVVTHLLQRELETFKDRVKTFKSKTIQYSTYKETCDELERELRNDKDTIDRLMKEKEKVQNDFLKVENEKLIIQHETQLEKKDFKEREDRCNFKPIHMLGKKPNKVYDPFLKVGLGYTNHVRLKKAVAAQLKMYDGDLIHNNKLVIHTTDSEETLADVEESRNKMRHKMIQIDYEKLNALYETFVPQQELSAAQT
ncbi:hypothetical protein Tco_1152938 [Tanacetum coccineum]